MAGDTWRSRSPSDWILGNLRDSPNVMLIGQSHAIGGYSAEQTI